MAVVVYTTPTCVHCKSAKRYLQERKVPYKEIDVTKSAQGAQDVQRKSGQTGVPVIVVNGTVIVGFNRPKLAKALGVRE